MKILRNHRRQKVIVLDVYVRLFAEFTPEVSVINEPERHLCTHFCIINKKAVGRGVYVKDMQLGREQPF